MIILLIDGTSISPIDLLAKQAEIYTSFMNTRDKKIKLESEETDKSNRRVCMGNLPYILETKRKR